MLCRTKQWSRRGETLVRFDMSCRRGSLLPLEGRMKISSSLLLAVVTFVVVQPSMSESKFDQKQEQPLFIAVAKNDPAFAEAIAHAQESLPAFRQLLSEPKHSRAAGTIRMIKVFVSEG